MRVSIIIPAFNAERFIDDAIATALAAGSRVQGGFELIVVDNNSTDNTRILIEAAAAKYPSCLRAAHTKRPGAPAARNHGVSLSSGEWLQFLDADDSITPDKIKNQLEIAGNAEWIVGAYRHVWPDGSTLDNIPNPDLWRGLFHDYRTGNTHSNLITRSALDRVGGWNEGLASNQDPDLWFRLLKAGVPYVIDPLVASYYRHHTGERITSSDPAGAQQRRIQMLAAANAYLIDQQPRYWHTNAPYFLGALLRAIRLLATHDLDSATDAYAAYFGKPNEWAIDRPYEIVGHYTRLYPYLGFRNLERLRLALAGVLPENVKRLLKA